MRWAFAMVISSGCAIGSADDRGGVAYSSGAPVSETGHEDERDDESSSDDASDPDGASGPAATLPLPPDDESSSSSDDDGPAPSDDTTTGAPEPDEDDDTSTGAPDDPDPGVLPSDGPWSECSGASCDPGYACIEPMQGAGGVCTVGCVAAGDASACPAAPGEIVAPVCITVQGTPLCALDCSGGLQCPSGSTCVIDSDDNGAIAVCL